MHNVNVTAVETTINQARSDPSVALQRVSLDGEWSTESGPQFTATVPVPNGESFTFGEWSCAVCGLTPRRR